MTKKEEKSLAAVLKQDIIFVLILLLLVLVSIWTIFPRFTTHIIGDGGDASIFAWNLWWVKYSLVELKKSPFFTDYIFYPQGTSLVFHTLTLINGLVSIPLQYVFSLTVVHNLIFVFSIILSGISSFYLARFCKLNQLNSIVAATIFTLSPAFFVQALGHFNLTTNWFIPAGLLFFLRLLEKPNAKNAVPAGIILALAVINDFYIGSYLAVISVIFFAGYLLLVRLRFNLELLKYGLIYFFCCFVLLIPLLAELKLGKINLPPANFNEYGYYGADMVKFVIPSFLHPLLGGFYAQIKANLSFGIEGVVFLGWLPLVLFLISVLVLLGNKIKRRVHFKIWISLFAFLLLIWLALGPVVHYRGEEIKLLNQNLGIPYLILIKIPILNGLRTCSRFVLLAMLPFGLLAGFAVQEIQNYFSKKYLFSIILLILIVGDTLFEYNAWPIKMYDAKISPIYQIIARDTDDIHVLDLPLDLRTGRDWGYGKGFSKQQLAQSVHHKKLLSGYVSYTPEVTAKTVLESPGLSWFLNPENNLTEKDLREKGEIQETFKSLGVRYVILWRRDNYDDPRFVWSKEGLEKTQGYLTTIVGAEEIASDDFNILYRVPGV